MAAADVFGADEVDGAEDAAVVGAAVPDVVADVVAGVVAEVEVLGLVLPDSDVEAGACGPW